jgi:hypothetical protein
VGTKNLLTLTGQDRKLKRCGALFFAGIGLAYFGGTQWLGDRIGLGALIVAASGATGAVIGALLPLYQIRCPRCHLHWVRWAVAHLPAQDWLSWVFNFEDCPGCSHVVDESEAI